jgi:fluoroacetyl-CoA thioesterase
MELRPGLTSEVEHMVTAADTALALGSGDVPVLGTPKILALAEAATVAAVAAALDAGSTSVGTGVALRHRAATAVGDRVVASAELTGVDGGTLIFTVSVRDGEGRVVADGEVERAVVARDRFLARVGAR